MAAIVLALAVGAKIYLIVLAPLLFLSAWYRIGRPVALSAGVISLVLASLMVAPMLLREQANKIDTTHRHSDLPPIPPATSGDEETAPSEQSGPKIDDTATGLAAFAGQWQMNDFLFLLVFENLKPVTNVAAHDAGVGEPQREAWFAVTSRE